MASLFISALLYNQAFLLMISIENYIDRCILPQYDAFDAAHRRDHAQAVIRRSLEMARHYPELRTDLVLVAAACHDIGLAEGREFHHLASGRMIRSDKHLPQWFTADEIETMAQAAEDHRASSGRCPRSLLGMIVAEADRLIDAETVVRRTIQYGLAHYPQLNRLQHYERMRQHLQEKYSEQGYLKLFLPESPNAAPLKELQRLIHDEPQLKRMFDALFDELS